MIQIDIMPKSFIDGNAQLSYLVTGTIKNNQTQIPNANAFGVF